MTAIQFFNVLRQYGVDVLLLAIGVSLVTSLLKQTLFKDHKKACVFLPFVLGVIFYAVFRMIAVWSVSPVTEDLAATFDGGFSTGCAATLYYLVYEQFVRKKGNASPLIPLLEGVVAEENLGEAADALYAGAKERKDEARREFLMETLPAYAPELGEGELEATVLLIEKFLKALGV